MGSWNKTCALTGLHIEAGAPVHGFVIIESQYHSRTESTSLWTPILLPFTGTYDAYGNTENTSSDLMCLLDLLRPVIVAKKAGKNPYHERKVCPETLGVPEFFNSVADGRLRIKDGFSKESFLVEFVLVRTDAMLHILRNWNQTLFIGYDEDTNKKYFHYTYETLVPQVGVFLQRLHTELQDNGHNGRIHRFVRNLISDIRDNEKEPSVLRALCEYLGALFNEFAINRNIKALDIFDISWQKGCGAETLGKMLTGIFVHCFMCRSRKIWVPMCHEGSQATPLAEYKLLANTMQTLTKTMKRRNSA